MTQHAASPSVELVPETAPFTPEQRSWLNGFFAGLVSLDGAGITALSPEQNAALMPPAQNEFGDADDGEAPWHDPSLPLAERLTLAEGRPVRRRLMAAMAQQDCGQCGYSCEDYSNALFLKTEARLNLCVPGGKETARALKTLAPEIDRAASVKTLPAVAAVSAVTSVVALPPVMAAGPSRETPAEVRLAARYRLNKPGSDKQTWHIDIDLSQSGIDYQAGDAFGVFPINDSVLVDGVIATLGATADTPIGESTLREVLTDSVSLAPAPDSLFQLMSYISGGERKKKLKALAAGDDPDGDAATLDVLAALEKFPDVRPDPEAFVEALEPLQPRLYSISSSPKAKPGHVSLTIDAVRYRINGRERLGVASTCFADRLAVGDCVKAYVQKAHAFALPDDPSVPVIMVGPGTGVAPFRAFLQERMATRSRGRNWLFFGHQRRDYDFFYEDELAAMKASGLLTRMSLAWSRDDDQKFYVQDRMREVGAELWNWIKDGAHIYVCGDAKRMARDVEGALIEIVATHSARSTEEAIVFVGDLKKKSRYQQDVY
ncbi:MAG: sulfite reductase subunit alpha [Pseudolabrys sp.]